MTAISAPPSSALRIARMLTVLLALGILAGTLWPAHTPPVPFTLTDKAIHFGAFALLILPMALADPRRAWRLAPLCILFGGIIELVQPSVGRGAEWLDLAADALGVAAGLALGHVIRRLAWSR
ncbi:MAG: VanZ family protein [Roseovarius sp.]